jgi:hypothetical protein
MMLRKDCIAKSWVLMLLLTILIFGNSAIKAQSVTNPGYLGKTRSISLGSQISCGLYNGVKSQMMLAVAGEQTLNRQHSIVFRATGGVLNVPFEKRGLSVDGPGAGSAPIYYGSLDCGNPPSLITRSLGVQIKRYILNRGAIAPYGMYVTGGGEWRTVSSTDSFNQLVFIEDDYNSPSTAYHFALPSVMPRATKGFNVLVGVGNKRFFNQSYFLDYQFGMTWLFWSNISYYNNLDQDAAIGPSFNVQNSIELQMRQVDTRRQLFTFNITAGMVF